jgi:hypothetical protein
MMEKLKVQLIQLRCANNHLIVVISTSSLHILIFKYENYVNNSFIN